MKAVILAGGTGSRLYPLTKVTNKHLLPVGDKPMIFHSLQKIRQAGISEVLIVTGIDHMGDIVRLIGSGADLNLSVTYRVQDKPDGIAGALSLAQNFTKNDKFVVVLADNIFSSSIEDHVASFNDAPRGSCMLLLKEVDHPQRFGVATVENGSIKRITEKPKNSESNLCVTGIYFFDSSVFSKISNISPSQRGELEISDVNQLFVDEGMCKYRILDGWWTDAGTLPSYNLACQLTWEMSCKD
jgi:glucose-1-phosphate thymidylyltransferase